MLISACADQDKEASDTLDGAMELVKLNRLIRPAVALVKGMEIVHAHGQFEFSVLSAIPWFKAPLQRLADPLGLTCAIWQEA